MGLHPNMRIRIGSSPTGIGTSGFAILKTHRIQQWLNFSLLGLLAAPSTGRTGHSAGEGHKTR
jgi:hypothetical protein